MQTGLKHLRRREVYMQPVKQDSALKALILKKINQGKDYYLFHVPTLIIKPGEDRSARTLHPTLSGNETFMILMIEGSWHYTFSLDGKDNIGDIYDFYRLMHGSEPTIDDDTISHKINDELKLGLLMAESGPGNNGSSSPPTKFDEIDLLIDEDTLPEAENNQVDEHEPNLMKNEMDREDRLISALELLRMDITEIPCLVKPLLPLTGLAAIVGSSDSGKSCFCRQLAIAICKGERQFLGFELAVRTGRVIFVSSEDDLIATASLLKRQVGSQEQDNQNFSKLGFIFETQGLVIRLDKELTNNPADLVICDSYGDLVTISDSNAMVQVRQYLKSYSYLAKKHNCLILFVHHLGKRTEGNEPSKHNVIGSQGFEARMRVVLELRPDEENRRHLSPVKGNYLAQDMKRSSFVLLFDESSLTFTMTDERVSYSQIGVKKAGKKTYHVDWNAVFEADRELKLKVIEQKLAELYSMPKGSTSPYINDGLEKVPGNYGYWRIKSPDILSVEAHEQEELNPSPREGNNDPQS
jgi:hypothetical protein